MPVWMWFVAAGALVVAELFTGTFYMMVLAGAALCGSAAGYAGAGLSGQVGAAAMAALLGCGLVWRHHRAAGLDNDAGSLDAGQPVEVGAWRGDGTALVRYRGAQWCAVAQPGAERRPGIWVIVRIEGPRLLIAPQRPAA